MTDERFQKYFCKSETMSSLAAKYGVTRRTLYSWIRPIRDDLTPGFWSIIKPHDLRKIIDFLGEYDTKA